MSKRKERTPLSDRARGRALRTWGFYLLALTAWVTVVLLLAFLGYLVCSAITWYDPLSPLYLFLNWVRDYFVFVCALVVLAGWVVISYFFIARPVGQVEAMAQAAERLAEEPDVKDFYRLALAALLRSGDKPLTCEGCACRDCSRDKYPCNTCSRNDETITDQFRLQEGGEDI